jgi:hypothetical protein
MNNKLSLITDIITSVVHRIEKKRDVNLYISERRDENKTQKIKKFHIFYKNIISI